MTAPDHSLSQTASADEANSLGHASITTATLSPASDRGPDWLIAAAGWITAACAFIALNIANLLNRMAYDSANWHLDPDGEGNLFTWASIAAAGAASAAAMLSAWVVPTRRLPLLATSLIVAFLAADDLLQIHERLGDGIQPVILPNVPGIWFPLYAPFLAFVAIVLWFAFDLDRSAGRTIRIGLALLGLALLAESLVAVIPGMDGRAHGWGYTMASGCEEAAELAGWILIATGLLTIAYRGRWDVNRA